MAKMRCDIMPCGAANWDPDDTNPDATTGMLGVCVAAARETQFVQVRQ